MSHRNLGSDFERCHSFIRARSWLTSQDKGDWVVVEFEIFTAGGREMLETEASSGSQIHFENVGYRGTKARVRLGGECLGTWYAVARRVPVPDSDQR